MKSGKCPKCSSTNIYHGTPIGFQGAIAPSFFSAIQLTYFICAECGYVENYANDTAKLAKAKWTKGVP